MKWRQRRVRRRQLELAAVAVVLELRQSGSCRIKTREDLAVALGMERKDRAWAQWHRGAR